MKKRIMSLLLAAMLLASLVPASAEPGPEADIGVGDYLQMGEYYGKPILRRCIAVDGNGPLMLSDRILCYKCFDAKGSSGVGSHARGGDDSRTDFGSNYWGDSNIRDWLNSDAPAGSVVWSC